MKLLNLFKFSSKRKAEKNSFLVQANYLLNTLAEKAKNLGESYGEEKTQLYEVYEDVKQIKAEENPTAFKFEHSIVERAAIASALCDKAIIGKDDGEFRDAIKALASAVSQRLNFSSDE